MRRDLSLAAVAVCATALSTLALGASTLQVTSNTWAPTADMSEPRAGASAVLLYDGSILVTGGMNDARVTATAERYSPSSRQFVPIQSMATPRANHSSTLLADGRVLVAGGMGLDGRALGTAELYDPARDRWTAVSPLHVARAGHTATALRDGRVIIVGGNNAGGSLRSIEIFNPDTQAFEVSRALMANARTGHATALAADRTLLVSGGFDGARVLSSTELYDPFSDIVAPGPSLAEGRIGHSATTLADGRVLVAGGSGGAGELKSAEVYDSTVRALTATASSMVVGRQRHQALLLPHNGQVLIVGGTADGVAVAAAEVYVAWQGIGGTFYQTNAPTFARIWSAAAALSFLPSDKVRSGPGDGLLLLTGGSRLADARAPFRTSELYGFATVKTDKADYAPGTPVMITGSGWVPRETVTLLLREVPDVDQHRPLVAIADPNGNIINTDFAPDEHDLNVLFYLTATGSASQAQTTFTDSLNAMSATLDGHAAVTRVRSGAITANVNVTSASTIWHSTGWRIAAATGTFVCENTPDHDVDGTFSESFTITAPGGVGTFNAYFAAFSDDACATRPSATLTLPNAVVVDAAVPLTDTTAPAVTSMTLAGSTPTNASIVRWNVTFSEPVTGVNPSDFTLTVSGLAGTPSIASVSGNGATYTVTASTGTHSGTLRLDLVDDDSIVDAAGNALGGPGAGNGSTTGAAYFVDRTLSPRVMVENKAFDGTKSATIAVRSLEGNLAPGDDVSLTGGTATFDSEAVGSSKLVTVTGLGLSGAAAPRYVLSATTATTIAAITETPATERDGSGSGSGEGDTSAFVAPATAHTVRGTPSFVPAFVPTAGYPSGSAPAPKETVAAPPSDEDKPAAPADADAGEEAVLGPLRTTVFGQRIVATFGGAIAPGAATLRSILSTNTPRAIAERVRRVPAAQKSAQGRIASRSGKSPRRSEISSLRAHVASAVNRSARAARSSASTAAKRGGTSVRRKSLPRSGNTARNGRIYSPPVSRQRNNTHSASTPSTHRIFLP